MYTVWLIQRALGKCNWCQDKVKFLAIELRLISEPFSSFLSSVSPWLILYFQNIQLHDMFSLVSRTVICYAFSQEWFSFVTYLFHSFIYCCYSRLRSKKSQLLIAPMISSKSYQVEECSLRSIHIGSNPVLISLYSLLHKYQVSSGERFTFFLTTIILKICTLSSALTIYCALPLIEN